MKLGKPDESGRRRPVPIEDSEFVIPVDTVIISIGQKPDTSYLPENSNIKLNEKWESFLVDEDTFQTSVPGIFAGGDAVTGPATVIDAIAHGKEAAISIERYIKNEDLKAGRKPELKKAENVEMPDYLSNLKRVKNQYVQSKDRISNFNEVQIGLTEEQVKSEAARCLACGGCCDCRECEKVCEPDAIVYDMEDETIEEEVGAVIVATGYELYPKEKLIEYGSGNYPDVINGLQFERLLSASGPTEGEILRPSDKKIPKRVAFISCAGSRDPEYHLPYCSRICCMYNVKHAFLYKENVPDGEAIVFNIDVRTSGKDYEEFFTRAKDEENILYLRGKPSRIIKEGNDLVVWSVNTLTGKHIRVKCDLVVLSTAIVPSLEATELSKQLRIPVNVNGMFNEVHPKLRPVESIVPGFFLAGCCHSPKDIPDSVAQASAAASKVLEMFSQKELSLEPLIASVDDELCSACRICISACPYEAREFDEENDIVAVNEVLCACCGSCVSACPSGASQQKNLSDNQISKMVEVILEQ